MTEQHAPVSREIANDAFATFEAAVSNPTSTPTIISLTDSTNRNQNGRSKETTVSRTPSYTHGQEFLNVDKRRSVSYTQLPESNHPRTESSEVNARLRRRNGVRLPKLFTGLHNPKNATSAHSLTPDSALSLNSPMSQRTRSAGPTFGGEAPRSPTYIGRGATGLFPSRSKSRLKISKPTAVVQAVAAPSVVLHSPARIDEDDAGTHPPPAMDTENDVSLHYTRLIRTIDHDHRKAMHERDKELGEMRERLNEVDQVYRQELKARDFIIDDLKKRLDNMEEQVQSKLERARNEVEDIWEVRWKDRDRHLIERMRRIELDGQKNLEHAIHERDEAWTTDWQKKNEQLVQRLKAAEKI